MVTAHGFTTPKPSQPQLSWIEPASDYILIRCSGHASNPKAFIKQEHASRLEHKPRPGSIHKPVIHNKEDADQLLEVSLVPNYITSIQTTTWVVSPPDWDAKLILVSHYIQLLNIFWLILPHLDLLNLSYPMKLNGFPTHLIFVQHELTMIWAYQYYWD